MIFYGFARVSVKINFSGGKDFREEETLGKS
jgi:hypothetical protein